MRIDVSEKLQELTEAVYNLTGGVVYYSQGGHTAIISSDYGLFSVDPAMEPMFSRYDDREPFGYKAMTLEDIKEFVEDDLV